MQKLNIKEKTWTTRELKESSDLDADEIQKLEDTVELLSEQIESLKQLLRCECEVTEVYRQELRDTERELRYTNSELQTACMLETLGLDEAKEVASSIVKSNKSVGESLAKLLSAIYNSPVKTSDLGYIEGFRFRKSSKNQLEKQVV